MKYVILIKTDPYTRTKHGKLEHVSGYADWRREQDKATIAKWKEIREKPKGYRQGILGDRTGTKEEQEEHKERESREELRALLHKGENMKYVILEKAQVKPYVRTRRGKFERVGGYERARLDEAGYDAYMKDRKAEEEADDYIDRELKEPSPTVVPGSAKKFKEIKRTLASHKRARWNAQDRFNARMKSDIATMATPEQAFDHLVSHRVDEMMAVHLLKEKFGLSNEEVMKLMNPEVSRTVIPDTAAPVSGAKEVAMTILQQMGGVSRLQAMTGAKNFMYFDERGVKGVSFDFPNRGNKPNHIKIFLDEPTDTYNVEFGKKRAISWKRMARMHEEGKEASMSDFYKITSTHSDIYFDQLKELFERSTGLYLSLTKAMVIMEKGRGPDKQKRKSRGMMKVRNPNPREGGFIWVPKKAKNVEKVEQKIINWPKKETAMGTKDYLD